jgi:YgiT-type zinc finger domain-containing protein
VTKAFVLDHKPVVVEDIPALICERCGDTTFEATVSEQVRKLVREPHEPQRRVQAEVLQFRAA